MKYFGPFPIIECIGSVAYKLLLPPTAKIHPVFHCSQLKPCRGDHTQQYIPAITIDFETPPVIQPAAMLQDRQIMQGNKIVKQFLIQWEGLEESAPTWEDENALRNAYPTFNLEDKVNFKGGGIVTRVEEKHGSRRVRKKNIRLNDYDWAGKLCGMVRRSFTRCIGCTMCNCGVEECMMWHNRASQGMGHNLTMMTVKHVNEHGGTTEGTRNNTRLSDNNNVNAEEG
ncbi:hypothetical protein V8G54_033597 [Vigna mungo]|uniref:Chromo domain-containing protein n=1 Tax=Vigna mungo TaxID=3915 RepID=A0AAQ3MN72_VIGMU